MANNRVVVIGAGGAGIYATHLLKAKGVPVVCLEAGPAVGGRAAAYTKDGYICEVGALGTEPQWSLTRGLVNELGMESEYNFGRTMRVGFWRNNRLNLVGIGTKAQQLRWLPETVRFRGISAKALFETVKVALALRKDVKNIQARTTSPADNDFEELLYLGNTSLEEYVLRHGGRAALDGVFAPFMSLMVLGNPEDICITHMIALLLSSAEGGKTAGGFVWMERGIGSILQAAYEKDKELYRLSTAVQKVVVKDGAVIGVETSDEFIEANYVICATTATTALKLIPDLPETSQKMLRSVKYSSSFNYIIGDRRKFTPENFTMEFIPDTDPKPFFKVLLDSAQRSRSYAPGGATLLHCMTSSHYHERLRNMTEPDRRALVIKEAQKIFPAMPDQPDLVEFVQWDEAISQDAPGQIVAVHDYEQNHVNDVRGLHLAGEYLYPLASVEGAMTSSAKAVSRVLDELLAAALAQ